MRQRDDGGDDGALLAVFRRLGDEGAVDLHLVDREALEVREARVAGAEVVDRDRDAELLQAPERAERDVGVLHGERLGDLELEQPRRQPGFLERLRHHLGELRIVELPRREVDRDLQAALGADEGRPAAGFAQHPFADLEDQAALLGDLDELARRHQAALGMLPAHQRLVADHFAALRLDDALVVQPQLALADGAAQIGLEREAPRGRLVHLLGEELVVGAPELLRVVHGGVGVADQRLGIAAVVGEHRDADRAGDGELALVDRGGLRHVLDHFLRHLRDVGRALHLR